MEKLYVVTRVGNPYKAFTNADTANRCLYNLNQFYPGCELEEIYLPFIGRSVCYISAYFGYDYIYSTIDSVGSMRYIHNTSQVYACLDHLKKNDLWSKYENIAKEDPNNYVIKNDMIASLESEYSNQPFTFGDCMAGKFNITIKRIRVIKK